MRRLAPFAVAVGSFLLLALMGRVAPSWVVFLATMAFAKGLVALGLVLLMRGGLVSFGQGLFYCAGAYAAGLAMRWSGANDAPLLVVLGAAVALVIGLVLAPLLSGYRSIFFATLTLSMMAYGVLNKTYSLGGSDGINLRAASFLGYHPATPAAQSYALFVCAALITVAAAALCRRHFDSLRGLLSLAARDNEIRVEYLGASVRRVAFGNFAAAAALAGAGGALAALALGHVDPDFAFWTSSGEFVFLAILAGYQSVVAVFLASVILELVRSFSSQYFPNSWQMALGIFLLLVILFLPEGLGSLLRRRRAGAADTVPRALERLR
jgi:ABC-type branched-subunit amino acid transport system permease subunit